MISQTRDHGNINSGPFAVIQDNLQQLRKMRRKIIRLYHNAKKKMNAYHWNKYKVFRNEYQCNLDKAEGDYTQALNDSLKQNRNNKGWWATVKRIIGKGNDDSYPPIINPDSNTHVSNLKEKATLFNNLFLSHSNINLTNSKLPDLNKTPEITLNNVIATEKEVHDLIMAIDVNKSTGHDGLSPRLIKIAGAAIVPSLTKLFNTCLVNKRVPSDWKKANVIPLHKKDDRDALNNYRPVSILPAISKLFERVIFKQVYNFFHQNKLLTKHQSGFRPNDSTVNQLAYMYHIFCEALDKKKDIRIVFCDISKAFDRVWHAGIIHKLRQLGITGNLLALFQDYLNNRQQRVLIKGQHSEWGLIKAGLPQGSVLGPLLFLVYINDLASVVDCEIKLFADDTLLYVINDDQDHSANLLNSNLRNVQQWADQWLVTFSPQKTKLMNITQKKNQQWDNFPLHFNNVLLEPVVNHKHLGLNLNVKLKWADHIDNIIESVSKMLHVLQKLKYSLDIKKHLKQFISHLCVPNWNMHALFGMTAQMMIKSG